jgi:epoxyqueuosine reductase
MTASEVKLLARDCGFELAGIALAEPISDAGRFSDWAARGLAGRMGYLTDHRAVVRLDPRNLLPSARSMLCVGKVYNGPQAHSIDRTDSELAWISRYAWGQDYHRILRQNLERVAGAITERTACEYRICVDTAPLLERSYARMAGLGWIGRNTCLINQQLGSWIFLAELLLSIDLQPDHPPADRCGSCRRCIDACPTSAIVPAPDGNSWELDARLCISYFTIELRGAIPEEQRASLGKHVFGCDICQDVCPWNRRAAVTSDPAFLPMYEEPPLEHLASISEAEFREMFRPTPIERARYSGFLRNVAVAMGNSGAGKFAGPLERLARTSDEIVAEHARWALDRLNSRQL